MPGLAERDGRQQFTGISRMLVCKISWSESALQVACLNLPLMMQKRRQARARNPHHNQNFRAVEQELIAVLMTGRRIPVSRQTRYQQWFGACPAVRANRRLMTYASARDERESVWIRTLYFVCLPRHHCATTKPPFASNIAERCNAGRSIAFNLSVYEWCLEVLRKKQSHPKRVDKNNAAITDSSFREIGASGELLSGQCDIYQFGRR